MDRYVIVCLIKGEPLEFHEKLAGDICSKFKVKRQKLPAHFTIKAPFETDRIDEVEAITKDFCEKNQASDFKIEGFGHFRDSVIYMDIHAGTKAVKVHDDYIDVLKRVPWLEWKRNEGKGRVFHCTLVSKLPEGKFKDIWEYVLNYQCSYESSFDNISILKWKRDRWNTYREFELKK